MLATKSRYSRDGHVGVERRRFRQVAGPPLGFDRLIEDVEAGHHRAAFRRRHVAGQDPHRRGLSGAVRPEEPEDLPSLDAKADIVHGGDAAVALRDVLNLDHTVAPFLTLQGSPGAQGVLDPASADLAVRRIDCVRYRQKADYRPNSHTTEHREKCVKPPRWGGLAAPRLDRRAVGALAYI